MAPRVSPLSKRFNEETVKYRGIDYTIREVSSREFDDIQQKATVSRETDEGTAETLDVALRDKLLLAASLVEGMPESGIGDLPMRIRANLSAMVTRLHFGIEPDEMKKVGKDGKEEPQADDEEAPKGNP